LLCGLVALLALRNGLFDPHSSLRADSAAHGKDFDVRYGSISLCLSS
jgi:hypothetical protein